VVINAGRPIVPADFGMSGANEGKLAVAATDAPLSFREAREKFEREYFTRILQLAGGNVSEAARQSGIARQNFYSHVERLGIVAKS
jgi:two-component system response regulator AtoC